MNHSTQSLPDADTDRLVGRPVILLIDDEVQEARMLETALSEVGFDADLRHVLCGWDALRFVERRGAFADAPAPDLVLVDLEMPAMHGQELIQHLRRGPTPLRVPVLAYSNSTRVTDFKECRRLGADHFMIKPFGYDGYVNVIGQLREWLAKAKAS
ncbi:MAG TPA: response regulator [Planctomycetota bacterium]|nr:response regulator [Planctomycetota bacterium]